MRHLGRDSVTPRPPLDFSTQFLPLSVNCLFAYATLEPMFLWQVYLPVFQLFSFVNFIKASSRYALVDAIRVLQEVKM